MIVHLCPFSTPINSVDCGFHISLYLLLICPRSRECTSRIVFLEVTMSSFFSFDRSTFSLKLCAINRGISEYFVSISSSSDFRNTSKLSRDCRKSGVVGKILRQNPLSRYCYVWSRSPMRILFDCLTIWVDR